MAHGDTHHKTIGYIPTRTSRNQKGFMKQAPLV